MARPKRSKHIDLPGEIKRVAWEIIAENGAASLSLRQIARVLNITAPAIYNYFPRRDDLVTALIIDAYTAFGSAQLASVAEISEKDFAGQIRAVGTAYRKWAVENPQAYQLIFGTPLPGYIAPVEKTMPAASRSLSALISALENARMAGRIRPTRISDLPPALLDRLIALTAVHPVAEPVVLYLVLVLWSRVHGLVSLELGNQFPPFLKDPGELFRLEVEAIIVEILE